jgi:hypothetical protein
MIDIICLRWFSQLGNHGGSSVGETSAVLLFLSSAFHDTPTLPYLRRFDNSNENGNKEEVLYRTGM